MRLFEMVVRPPEKDELWFVPPVRRFFACNSWDEFWCSDGFSWLFDNLTVGFVNETSRKENIQKKHPRASSDKIYEIMNRRVEEWIKQQLQTSNQCVVGFGENGDPAADDYEEFRVQVTIHEVSTAVVKGMEKLGLLGMQRD